ncbi:CEN-like protein 2 [Nymphaea thermarum]|nr:CEN-like protein 2 [Nymphaea thermarum]
MARVFEPLVVGRVIGDVLEDFSPSIKMSVVYNSSKQVCNGHEFMPSVVQPKPRAEVNGGDLRSFFTLNIQKNACLLVRPLMVESLESVIHCYLHGRRMVTDIPGTTDVSFGEIHTHSIKLMVSIDGVFVGKEVVAYESPKPYIGIHRFVFALFKQKKRQCVSPPSSRDHFNTKKFARDNDLGLPVAAVYFNAQRQTAARRR